MVDWFVLSMLDLDEPRADHHYLRTAAFVTYHRPSHRDGGYNEASVPLQCILCRAAR